MNTHQPRFEVARLVILAVHSGFRAYRANAEPEQDLWPEPPARVPHRHTPTVEGPVTSEGTMRGPVALADRERCETPRTKEVKGHVSKIRANSDRLFGQ